MSSDMLCANFHRTRSENFTPQSPSSILNIHACNRIAVHCHSGGRNQPCLKSLYLLSNVETRRFAKILKQDQTISNIGIQRLDICGAKQCATTINFIMQNSVLGELSWSQISRKRTNTKSIQKYTKDYKSIHSQNVLSCTRIIYLKSARSISRHLHNIGQSHRQTP